MCDIPRRTRSELQFIYSRERGRRDIYVEGGFDAAVLDWFFHECGLSDVAVYPIESIEVSDAEILADGRRANNRERVVQLASWIRAMKASRASCVVDGDFCHLRADPPPRLPLFATDYSCMEMYFFSRASFRKVLSLCCRKSNWPIDEVMAALASVLQEWFVLRCANDDLNWGMDWLDKVSCVSIAGWRIDFERDVFIQRLLNKNRRAAQEATFNAAVASYRHRLGPDPRRQMHGHDLTALLAWYLRIQGVSREHCRSESMEEFMLLTLECASLRKERLFKRLKARLA
jgi:hypothetical protein